MSVAWVHLSASDGGSAHLYPGDLIGRSWRAELSIVDPSESEFHAAISLRNGEIRIRKLGGPLRVHGMAATEVVAKAGIRIGLSSEAFVDVVEVRLPEQLSALQLDGGRPQPLVASRHGLTEAGSVVPASDAADALVWTDGDQWLLSDGGTVLPLDEGQTDWRGRELTLIQVSVAAGEVLPTRRLERYVPVRLTARYNTVQIHQEGEPVLILAGQLARLLTEVAQLGPAPWHVVAGEMWPRLRDRMVLRKRWDKVLARVRHKLREARVRTDLLRSTGGQVELLVMPGDTIELSD